MAWVLLYSPLPCGYLERKVGDAPSFFFILLSETSLERVVDAQTQPEGG